MRPDIERWPAWDQPFSQPVPQNDEKLSTLKDERDAFQADLLEGMDMDPLTKAYAAGWGY